MTEDEKQLIKELEQNRNSLQNTLDELRQMRLERAEKNFEKQESLISEIGKISVTISAVLIPFLFATADQRINNDIIFLLIGSLLYLLIGFAALWSNKVDIEYDSNQIPHIGMKEEIILSKIIGSYNKLISDPKNKEYSNELIEANREGLATGAPQDSKMKLSFWADALLCGFMIATILISHLVWPYSEMVYWLIFASVLVFLAFLSITSYIKALKSHHELQLLKRQRDEQQNNYKKWHNKNIFG